MTRTLALCFDAPMQSWGIRARGILRDTAMEPTKSGTLGVLAAAMGIDRDDTPRLKRLAALRLGVRVDREGLLERDFHTTQNVPTTAGRGHRTVVSERYYLADALFLVALEGPSDLIAEIGDSVQRPRWPVYLGRRAFVPTRPLFLGFHDTTLEQVLREHVWLEHPDRIRQHDRFATDRLGLRVVVDCEAKAVGAQLRHDVPLSFAQIDRQFATRSVLVDHVPLTDDMITPGDRSCS
ncbi:type I-E CRISPR-associated protein Cas5/CasD [Umezawaea sp. NPDC059074]|uniref:type I-E CRISPR-associated protein Cas5/CasD n=1 Tax=Umezawaea sp. NPDC059074 TaxID=3346716 RepID=UPI00367E2435